LLARVSDGDSSSRTWQGHTKRHSRCRARMSPCPFLRYALMPGLGTYWLPRSLLFSSGSDDMRSGRQKSLCNMLATIWPLWRRRRLKLTSAPSPAMMR
jgi:hypothetical protein